MRLKSLIVIILSLILLIANPSSVFAKKRLQHRQKSPLPPKTAWVKLKLRSDRHALLLMLGGMHYTDSLDYILTYNAGPVPQGIQSYHTPTDGNTQKELVFGTCSNGDCLYHGNITDMILEITIKLKDGQTIIQRYQINP
jgi:hypothetical protein